MVVGKDGESALEKMKKKPNKLSSIGYIYTSTSLRSLIYLPLISTSHNCSVQTNIRIFQRGFKYSLNLDVLKKLQIKGGGEGDIPSPTTTSREKLNFD